MAAEICEHPAPPRTLRLPPAIAPEADVVVRGERWRLTAALAYEDCVELRLSANGAERILLWPFDRVTPCAARSGPCVVRARRWAAWLADRAADPARGWLRVERTAVVDVLAYQLEPALAIREGRLRLLLADEVGLGKTIQAGWIVADACARHRNARVLVAVPAGLRHQWREELQARFEIESTLADARWLRRAAADVPSDVNPWSLPGVHVCSIDFLKRPEVLEGVTAVDWDLLIADEAHAAAAPTERHAALRVLAARSRAVVLITATPYSGDAGASESLARLGAIDGEPPLLMFRRSRLDIGDVRPRRRRLASVRLTAAEQRLHRLLARYTRAVWREAGPEGDRARLAMIVLRKRALSSAAAAAVSLRRRLDLLQRRSAVERQLPLFPDDELLEDAEPDEALAAPGLADHAHEHRWLRSLTAAAAAVRQESKLRYLTRLLRRIGGEPAIVFTEYRDTLQRLAPAIGAGLVLHGGMTAGERLAVVRAFSTRGGRLVATDAAAEGLNLQARCRLAISYELPWNPARLEQRVGRVDRIGQRRTVHAITLVARDTAEDLILANVARRLTRIAARFGADDRLAAFLSETLTAQTVIGGHPALPEPERPAADATLVDAPGEDLRRAAIEEAQTLAGRLRSASSANRAVMHDATVISSTDASKALPSGVVFVVEWSARTKGGDTIRVELLTVHVPARVARPRDRDAARVAARQVLERYGDAIAPAIADRVSALAAETRVRHERALDSCAARERGLATAGRATLVQPGLFDRHALIEAEHRRDAAAQLHEERLLRLERLHASREVLDGWRVIGVLIAGARV